MVDGIDGDDIYRMVEDEFYLIANKFTAHLHAAEYQKLQEEAKSHNAATIRNISRPVVGRMTDLAKKKHERSSRVQRHKRVTERDHDESGNDNIKATSLFGLMESPRKKIPRLDLFVHGSMATKPLVTSRSRRQESSTTDENRVRLVDSRPVPRNPAAISSEDEDDDLDAIPQRKCNLPSPKLPRLNNTRPASSTAYEHVKTTSLPRSDQNVALRGPKPAQTGQEEDIRSSTSEDDSDGALFGFQKRAKSRSRHKVNTTQSSSSNPSSKSIRDCIPGFNQG